MHFIIISKIIPKFKNEIYKLAIMCPNFKEKLQTNFSILK